MHARVGRPKLLWALPLSLLLSFGCSGSGDPPTGDSECPIPAQYNNDNPGYPFNLGTFETAVLPALQSCSACHEAGALNEDVFKIWATTAEKGNCDFVDTFTAVADKADTTVVDNSPLLVAFEGAIVEHGAIPAETVQVFRDFIEDANATCVDDGQCQPADGLSGFFDPDVFATQIQPALDAAGGAGCATAGCHLAPGQGGFSLNPAPEPGSAEMKANFDLIGDNSRYAALTSEPNQTLIYVNATTVHGSGTSRTLDAAGAQALLDWITAAKTLYDEQDNPLPPPTNCADATLLSLRVWEGEILGMLRGEIDYNDPNNNNILTGCTRGPCHGQPRPNSFDLVGTPEEALKKFACFIDLNSPSRSPVLACPGGGTCRVRPHPGDRLFVDAEDANYQKMLNFLFASVAGKSPVDFAQFARTINPLFDSEEACNDDLDNITCADTGACHGVQIAGADPPNGSDFGIIPNANEGDVGILKTNYAQAHNFVNFGIPEAGSIFLYPTNLNADVNNEFATGIPHGAGQCFAADSAEADLILGWEEGIRPDDDGFVTQFIITGAFASEDPDEEALFGERTITPAIFDESNGQQLGGLWDFFESVEQVNDIGAVLDAQGGAVGNGRIAYAAFYILNTTNRDLDIQIDIATDNEIEGYFENSIASSPANGGNLSLRSIIPPFAPNTPVPRVLLRVFQAADDAAMAFSVRLVDGRNGVPFDGADDDIVIVNAFDGGF